jgi:lipid-binding SYLF domain-containing protein
LKLLKHSKVISIIFMSLAVGIIQVPLACRVASAGMADDIAQAVNVVERFQDMPEQAIPPSVLKQAKGIAILTVVKAGFIFSGRGGTGLVLARTENGWSGPSAIGTGGIGVGFQIGAQVSEFVMILNSPKAVQAFAQGGNVSLGADLSAAAGPVGRSAALDVLPLAAVYTYSRSQGLFAGISLEGTVIAARDDTNAKYYGRSVQPSEILSGKVVPPANAQKLIRLLEKY